MALSPPTRATVTIAGDGPPPDDSPEVLALREALAASQALLGAAENARDAALAIIARARTDMDGEVNRWTTVTRWTGKLTATQLRYAKASLAFAQAARERL